MSLRRACSGQEGLLHRCEDLSLIPSLHTKAGCPTAHLYNPKAGVSRGHGEGWPDRRTPGAWLPTRLAKISKLEV